jgi:hypothetical protein
MRRFGAIGAAVAVLFIGSVGIARAVFPTDGVTSYAGCLATNASPGGTFINVAVGDKPSKPCGTGQVLVHLSGGDITSVVAGQGLAGGGENGAATLSLATGQALPQTCADGRVPKWDRVSWSCGIDNDTTYSSGTGLDLSGTTFSVDPTYRLPQANCDAGEVAKWNGSTWLCAADDNTGGGAWFVSNGAGVGLPNDGIDRFVTNKVLPAGSFAFIARVQVAGDQHHYSQATCSLRVFGDIIGSASEQVEKHTQDIGGADEGDWYDNMTITAVASHSIGSSVDLVCHSFDEGISIGNASILALQVAGLH